MNTQENVESRQSVAYTKDGDEVEYEATLSEFVRLATANQAAYSQTGKAVIRNLTYGVIGRHA